MWCQEKQQQKKSMSFDVRSLCEEKKYQVNKFNIVFEENLFSASSLDAPINECSCQGKTKEKKRKVNRKKRAIE